MEQEIPIPVVQVLLETDENGDWIWFMWSETPCPYCGGLHEHLGGPKKGDPEAFLGYRTPLCEEGADSVGYILEWLKSDRELMAEKRS